MRRELQAHFLNYARVDQSQRAMRTFRNAGVTEREPNIYVYFADRQAGYIHEWTISDEGTATIGHFAVAKELEGYGFGEALVRGFAQATQLELGVHRIVFRERARSPAYERLFQRLGARDTGRVLGYISEWEWVL